MSALGLLEHAKRMIEERGGLTPRLIARLQHEAGYTPALIAELVNIWKQKGSHQ